MRVVKCHENVNNCPGSEPGDGEELGDDDAPD